MGLYSSMRRSSSRWDTGGCNGSCAASVAARKQPNPKDHEVKSATTVNDYLILTIKYPNATNYEGLKILLFDKGTRLQTLRRQGGIDPHFLESETHIHPIARFEPTERGHAMAVKLAHSLSSSINW